MKNSRTRILSLLNDSFPPELRVENAAEGLSEAGFHVKLMARPSEIESNRWQKAVIPILPPGRLKRSLRGLGNRLGGLIRPSKTTNLSKKWISKYSRSFKPHILIWNDLAGAHIGLSVAREVGAKFILDLHENYPYNMWSTSRDRQSSSRRYSMGAWFAYEREMTTAADLILTPAQEMNERLNAMHFTPHGKMIEILNSEDHQTWDSLPLQSIPEMAPDRFHLLYVGSASIHRGLDIIARAIAEVKEEWPELLFTVVGSGRSVPELKKLIRELHLQDHVQLLGHRPFLEMASFIDQCHVGVVPHYRYGQTDNTLPHKLFQFAAMKKPVLVSNCKSLERIASDYKLGLVFQSGNVRAAANQLRKLKAKSLRDELGANGRRAIEGPLNLRKQQEKLVSAFNELLSQVV